MPLITNDAVVFGLLMAILASIFVTSHSSNPGWKKFYRFVPSLLLCYFIPSVFTSLGVIDPDESSLYYMASRYLLPASLVLLTLSIDLKAVMNLGWKAVAMFFAGTTGIIIGGPIALMIVSAINPEITAGAGPEEVWRGLSTVAGSWIGGGANQTAISWKEWLNKPANVSSERTGDVNGIHELIIKTATEEITLKHDALDRSIFAEGAIWATEQLVVNQHLKDGVHTFSELFDHVTQTQS